MEKGYIFYRGSIEKNSIVFTFCFFNKQRCKQNGFMQTQTIDNLMKKNKTQPRTQLYLDNNMWKEIYFQVEIFFFWINAEGSSI